MTATSGRKCIELLNKRDPLRSLLKTLLVTSRWDSTRCWLTWRAKATPLGRLYYQLVPKTPRIDVIDAGSSPSHWPTPNSRDYKDTLNSKPNRQTHLLDAVRAQLWPTPVSDGDRATNYKQGGTSLGYAARMWPTPDTNNHRDGTKLRKDNNLADGGRHGVSLHHAVAATPHQLWPTPTANEDACGTPSGKMQRMLGNHPEVRNTGQGTLNPDWVEQLMGYPAGWTCLDDGQTDLGKTERQE